MICTSCGANISDNANYCKACGAKIAKEYPTLQLRCRSCGGTLTINEDTPILACPFCGAQELIRESDSVTIQRIKSQTYKEIELERIKSAENLGIKAAEIRKEMQKEGEAYRYKHSALSKITIVFAVLCLLFGSVAFSDGAFWPGFIGIVQTIIFIISWLIGMRFIKTKLQQFHMPFFITGILLIVVFLIATSAT